MARQSKKVSQKKVATDQTIDLGVLMVMRLDQIDPESFQNQRTGDFRLGDSKESGENQSFSELVESMDLVGQKDPITVRRKAAGLVDNGMPYEVIKGFRRYAAKALLAQRDNRGELGDATINVIVKELDDLQALEENVFENTARDNLTGPDLAWAAHNLYEQYKVRGMPVSKNIVAKKMGKNQSYIAQLMKIVSQAPGIAKLWQDSPAPLTRDAMLELAELPGDQQMPEYERINAELAGKKASGGAPAKPPVVTATKQAERLAKILAALELLQLIEVKIDWAVDLKALPGVDAVDLTPQDVRIVAAAAAKAFQDVKEPPAKTAAKAEKTPTAEQALQSAAQ